MFLVTGITGHVGGAAARQLLADGRKVRALVRDPKKAAEWTQRGVELQQGDSNDAEDVARALQGVEGAYLMLPPVMAPAPGFPEAKGIIASFREALKKTPPPKLVVLSSIGSEQTSGLGLITQTHLLEEALGDVPFPVAFVRAGSFYENYIGAMAAAAASGVFYTLPQPVDRPVPMIATEDIGKEVAKLLESSWTGKRIIELGSPVTPSELAQAMSAVLGRPVQAQAVPREQWTAVVEQFGFPRGGTAAYEEMQDGFNSGLIHFGVPGTIAVAGTLTAEQVYRQASRNRS